MTRHPKASDTDVAGSSSSRRYRRVETSLWTDRKFQELSGPPPNAQTLWQYLLTGQRTTVFPGLVVATPAVIGSDLGWPVDRDLFTHGNQGSLPVDNLWTRPSDASADASPTRLGRVPARVCTCVRDALSELVEKGMIEYDSRSPIILLTKALFTAPGVIRGSNKPGSANQLKGWEKSWAEVPECAWKDRYLASLEAFCDGASKAMGNAFRKAFATHLGTRVGDASGTRRGRVADASPTRLLPETGTGSGSETGSDLRSEREEGGVDRAPRGDRGDVTITYGQPDPTGARDRTSRDYVPSATSPEPATAPQRDNVHEPTTGQVIPLLPYLRAPALAPVPRETIKSETIKSDHPEPAAAPQRDSVRPNPPEPAAAIRGTPSTSHPAAPTLRTAERSASAPDASEAARRARQSTAWTAWQRMNRERVEIAAELGLEPPLTLHHHLNGYAQLSLRIAESGEDAAAHLDKVFRVAAAVARASRSLRYFAPCMFSQGAWEAKLAMSFEDALAEASPSPSTPGGAAARNPSPRRRSAGPHDPNRNVFDAVDQATRAIEARLDDAVRARDGDSRDSRGAKTDHAGDDSSPDSVAVYDHHARDGTSRDMTAAHRREPQSASPPTIPNPDADDGDPHRAREVLRWH